MYVYDSSFIYPSLKGHPGCFYVLTIANSSVMNIGVCVSFSIMVSSGYMPQQWNCWVISLVLCGIRKVVQMNLCAGQEQRHRHREQMCGHRGRGMNWKTGTDVSALP